MEIHQRESGWRALMQMAPMKSLSLDGFNACFYQKHWKLIGDEVSSVVLNILQELGMASSFYSTYIALILKNYNPLVVIDFSPICLCNVIYKLVSKVIRNWLKHFMDSIISSSQNAFIPGCIIRYNILIANELLHSMKNNSRGRMGRMVVKLNMSKAYDWVELPYLAEAMKALGFMDRWIQLVMLCVTTIN